MTSTKQKFPWRLHVMVRAKTKQQLDEIRRRDPRFRSEADVVRYLLETYIPTLSAPGTDPFGGVEDAMPWAGRPDIAPPPPAVQKAPVALRPPGHNPGVE